MLKVKRKKKKNLSAYTFVTHLKYTASLKICKRKRVLNSSAVAKKQKNRIK